MATRKRITKAPTDNPEDIVRKQRRKIISFNLEVRDANKRGTFPIYLRVTEDRIHRRYKSSTELARRIDWNASSQDIAPTTVETYKERIKAKFGLDTVIQCVAAAVAKGIVSV